MSATPAARLESLPGADLHTLHANGAAPSPTELTGVVDGAVDGAVLTGRLSLPLVRNLGLWRGKAFNQDERGTVVGLNRLGIGPLEIRRYRFTARVTQSLFSDRDVIFLDHDHASNPPSIRRFHDELVAIEDGLYLATSHYRTGDDLRYLCHFTPGEALRDVTCIAARESTAGRRVSRSAPGRRVRRR